MRFLAFFPVILFQSALAYSQELNPNGTWEVELSGDVLARSFYHGEQNPHVGSVFSAVTYFGQESKDLKFLASLERVDEIHISYDAHLREIRLTGGGDVGTRLLQQDRSLLAARGKFVFISSTPLLSQVKMVAPGCLEYTGITERLSLSDSDTLDYYDRTVFAKFIAPSGDFGECATYLKKIRADIRNGLAPSFWVASIQSNGIDEGRIEDLVEMDLHFIYSDAS